MARYDLPAQLDFVLQYTEQEDMFYAGHSMGTTTLMAMHKYRPDLGAKYISSSYFKFITIIFPE